MARSLWHLTAVAAVWMVAACHCGAQTSGQPEPAALAVGIPAPDFTLPDQNNRPHHLAEYRGHTVILAFYPMDDTAG